MAGNSKIAFAKSLGEGRKITVLGNEIEYMLETAESGGEYVAFEAVSPPRSGAPPHVHLHEDEIIRVIEGEHDFWVGGKTHRLGPGGILHCPRGVPHGFQNVGRTQGRTFWLITPSRNFTSFFDELGALPPGPPEMEKVVAIFAKYGITILPST